MPNIVTYDLTVRGSDSHTLKELIAQSAAQSEFACFQNIRYGDGFTDTPDAIFIEGEWNWFAPFDEARLLSIAHPQLLFEFESSDISNGNYQRWWFEAGIFGLVDCIRYPYCDEDVCVVYCQEGIQLLQLPDWVPIQDRLLVVPVWRFPDWIPPRSDIRHRFLKGLPTSITRTGAMTILPIDLFKVISDVFPTIALSLSGITEDDCYELWNIKSGVATLIEMKKDETWYVKEGVEILPLPPKDGVDVAETSVSQEQRAPLTEEEALAQAEEDAAFLKELQDMG